ncbi:MAG: hypothetical protein ACREJM_10335, partial [Candidatus Saccharimonadales bacterium]
MGNAHRWALPTMRHRTRHLVNHPPCGDGVPTERGGGLRPGAVLSGSERVAVRANSQAGAPDFGLTGAQRLVLAAALSTKSPAGPPNAQERIAQVMTSFNCYACHARGGVGGPTPDRNPLFLTAIPEMGDEGRVPPPLDGVGDKLQEGWLKHVLAEGAKDRPYMLAPMPRFAAPEVTGLAEAFVALDQRTEAETPKLAEPPSRVKSTGRYLAG